MNQLFDNVIVKDELTEGAYNAVHTCLRIQPQEKVTMITDQRTLDIAGSIHQEIMKVGATCSVFMLEDFAPRPHTVMPQAILDDLAKSQVSVYAVHGQVGELVTRMQMTKVVTRHRLRHAHMLNINHQIMREGMCADFNKVDEISTRVWGLAKTAKYIRATTKRGTDVRAEFSPKIAARPVSDLRFS